MNEIIKKPNRQGNKYNLLSNKELRIKSTYTKKKQIDNLLWW